MAGSGSIFVFKECCFMVRVRVNVNLTLTLTLSPKQDS